MKFIQDYKTRQWLYGVFTAILVVLGGYNVVDAATSANLAALAAAVLNLGAASVTSLAASKANPQVAIKDAIATGELETVPTEATSD